MGKPLLLMSCDQQIHSKLLDGRCGEIVAALKSNLIVCICFFPRTIKVEVYDWDRDGRWVELQFWNEIESKHRPSFGSPKKLIISRRVNPFCPWHLSWYFHLIFFPYWLLFLSFHSFSQPRLHWGFYDKLPRASSRAEPVQRVWGE